MGKGIVALHVENVKRLKAVTIQPNGKSVVIVGGKNRSGKTSTLDAIAMALKGGKVIPDKPVRNGADGAEILLTTDDYIVHRTFAADGTSKLVVTSPDGKKYARPQDLLDKLIGSLAFDAEEFLRMKPAEQEDVLRQMVGLDTRELDARREIAFTDRTAINRDVKSLRAQLDGLPFHEDAPEEELSAEEIRDSLREAQEHNKHVDELNQVATEWADRVTELEQDRTECAAEIERLMELLRQENRKKVQLGREITEAGKALEEANAAAAGVKRIDEQEIVDKLTAVADVNKKISENAAHKKKAIELDTKSKESEDLTAQIKEIDAKKKAMLESAKYPVPGLSIHPEGGVYLHGVPLGQASGAEGIRCSLGIGVARNPDFPVVLIRNGSLLDEDALAEVEQFADETGCQVWMERVGEGEECSVIIAEGEVKVSRLQDEPALAN